MQLKAAAKDISHGDRFLFPPDRSATEIVLALIFALVLLARFRVGVARTAAERRVRPEFRGKVDVVTVLLEQMDLFVNICLDLFFQYSFFVLKKSAEKLNGRKPFFFNI